jgi:hypothetical protein
MRAYRHQRLPLQQLPFGLDDANARTTLATKSTPLSTQGWTGFV